MLKYYFINRPMGVFAILEEQVIYLYIYIIFTPKFLPNSTFPVSISKSN